MKIWLDNCSANHRDCGSKETPFLPTRVIDVEKICLHISLNGERSHYLALSYCWGGPQIFKTTNDTLASKTTALPLNALPKTLRDAVEITKQLGFRYLWIDSLCIIQDSESDVAVEINRMHLIFKHSTITIAAEVPSTVEQGFLHPRVLTKAVKFPFSTGAGIQGSVWTTPYDQQQLFGALATRAWAFQEIILAPRLMIFSPRGIMWWCRSASFQQDPLERKLGIENHLYNRRKSCRDAFSLKPGIIIPDSSYMSLLRGWRDIVSEFLGLGISFHRDRLPALAGIAHEYQSRIKDQYVAGMWLRRLVSQLGWRRRSDKSSLLPAPQHTEENVAPSWSWASVNAPIFLSDIFLVYMESTRAHVLGCQIEPLHQAAPFGQVKHGRLEVAAFMLPIEKISGLLLSCMDSTGAAFKANNQEGVIQCMVLGVITSNNTAYLEGLYLEALDDGIFRRIGLFRNSLTRAELRSEAAYNAWIDELGDARYYGASCSYDDWRNGQYYDNPDDYDDYGGWVVHLSKRERFIIV